MKIKITAFTISAVILIAMPIAQIIRFETVIARGKTYMLNVSQSTLMTRSAAGMSESESAMKSNSRDLN